MNRGRWTLQSFFASILFVTLFLHTSTQSILSSAIETTPTNYAVIINQVRGATCCGAGSVDAMRRQLDIAVERELPSTFVIRYDALNDTRYTDVLRSYRDRYPTLIQLGAMIEIIPTLAEDAGVPYTGNLDSWFHAQHAFTIGYAPSDREKIIDTLMERYKVVFGRYPTTTSAWLIDTPSVNRLHTRYGVLSHQITREQWGTDSYTLYGGPPHYPYPASTSWAFMPDYTDTTSSMLMLRQTVTDPMLNYGDTNSAHTSQPNDYARDGKSIAYYHTLLTNAFQQPAGQVGFALLGLENSMSDVYQEAYGEQLQWLADKQNDFNVKIVFADDAAMRKAYTSSSVSIYGRTEGTLGAWFVTTPRYRIRIRKSGDHIAITDIRIYGVKFTDPYTTRVALHEGFWIAPFLLDGSRWYAQAKPHSGPHAFYPVVNDFQAQPSQIELQNDTSGSTFVIKDADTIAMRNAAGRAFMIFETSSVELPRSADPQQSGGVWPLVFYPTAFPITHRMTEGVLTMSAFGTEKSPAIALRATECVDTFCSYDLSVQSGDAMMRAYEDLYPYLLPEPVRRELSQTYSKVHIHNRFAIAKRNPVRLVLEPHDAFNFPILLDNEAVITTEKPLAVQTIGELKKSQYQYVDLYSSDPVTSSVDITMTQGGVTTRHSVRLFFAPNCKSDLLFCVTHPVEGSWYVITKMIDWWEKRE